MSKDNKSCRYYIAATRSECGHKVAYGSYCQYHSDKTAPVGRGMLSAGSLYHNGASHGYTGVTKGGAL